MSTSHTVTAADPSADTSVTPSVGERFPFTTPQGSDARMCIQWKGTTVCLDFYCGCGVRGHFDGDFAHHLRCPACGAVYEMGTQVIAKRVDGSTVEHARDLDRD